MGLTASQQREDAALRLGLSRAKQAFHEAFAQRGLRASQVLPVPGKLALVPLSEEQAQVACACVLSSLDYRERAGLPLSPEERVGIQELLCCLSMPFVRDNGQDDFTARLAQWVHARLRASPMGEVLR